MTDRDRWLDTWSTSATVSPKALTFAGKSGHVRRNTQGRMIATLGGFLNRKADGFPGPEPLWIGLQRVPLFVLALAAQRSISESCG